MSSKKNILIVTSTLRTGSWICIRELALKAYKDFDISVVGAGSFAKKDEPFPVKRIPYFNHDEKIGTLAYSNAVTLFLFNLPLLFVFLFFLLIRRPNIFLTNGLLPALFLGPFAKLLGVKTVCAHHGYIGCLSSATVRLAKPFARFIDKIFVNSEFSKQDLLPLMNSKRMVVVKHWTEDLFFAETNRLDCRQSFNIDASKFVILFVGSIDKDKHIGILLEVIKKIEPKDNFLFLFAGSGPDLPLLEQAARKFSCIRHLGHIYDREKLRDLYAAADALWTYADETYIAKPAVEALACGTPLIIPDAIGAFRTDRNINRVRPDLIPSEIGSIIRSESIEDFVRYINSFKNICNAGQQRKECRSYAFKNHSSQNNQTALQALREA